jgi:hypothetical protein
MIIETIIGSITSIVLGSLWLANSLTKREAMLDKTEIDAEEKERNPPPKPDLKAMRATIAEKRRILERERDIFAAALKKVWSKNPALVKTNHKGMQEIDKQLFALADEEAKIPLE